MTYTIYNDTFCTLKELTGYDSVEDYNKECDTDYTDEWDIINDIMEMNWWDVRDALSSFKTNSIVAYGTLQLWNGSVNGYRICNNILDMFKDYDNYNLYVDRYGQLRMNLYHHDGTHSLLLRELKDSITDEQLENLEDKLYNGTITQKSMSYYTKPLGKALIKWIEG